MKFSAKRWLAPLLLIGSIAAITAACTSPGGPVAPSGQSVSLRLLAFNDFHGNLEPTGLTLALPDPADATKILRVNTGGAAFLAGKLAELKKGSPNTLILETGDLIGASPLVSSFFFDEPTGEIVNTIGVDIGVVGNHEFDKGFKNLKRLATGGCATEVKDPNLTSCAGTSKTFAGFKHTTLAANVTDAQGKPVFDPYTVREIGGIKIGFIGVVTRTTPTIVVPAGVAGLKFLDEATTINKYVDELKGKGIKAIIVMAHEGGSVDTTWNDKSCTGARGEIFDIVKKLSPEVDAVFSAHSHQGYNCVVNGIPVMQAFAFGRGISQLDLVLDGASKDVDRSKTVAVNVPVVNALNTDAAVLAKFPVVPKDAAVEKIVAEYAALAAPRASREIGQITATIDRNASPGGDHAAGRLIADAQLAATRAAERGGAQLSFMNTGGVRADFNCALAAGKTACPVTFGAAFTVQPFGNSLVVMTLTGQQIKDLMEQQFSAGSDRPRVLQPSKGLTYTWDSNASVGAKVTDLRLNGAPIAPAANYRVTVNSFLSEGGDGYPILIAGKDKLGGAQDIDALIEFLATSKSYAPDTTPRITRLN